MDVLTKLPIAGSGAFAPSDLSNLLLWPGGDYDPNGPIDQRQVVRSRESYGSYRAPLPACMANFDGTDDIAQAAADLVLSADWTICFWMKADALGGTQIGEIANNDYIAVGASSVIVRCNGINDTISITGGALSTAQLYFCAITRNSDTLTFYVDGSPRGTLASAETSAMSLGQLSGYTGTAGLEFNGRLADVRFYSAAKSLSEVQAIYNSGLSDWSSDGPDLTNLVAGWALNERVGTTHFDWSGNGNDLTISNATTTFGGSYHATDSDLQFNPANQVGYSDGATNQIVPRDESSPTNDVDGGALDYTGKCPYPTTIETPCITGDGSSVYVDLGQPLLPASADFELEIYYYHKTNSATVRAIFAQHTSGVSGRCLLTTNSTGISFQLIGSSTLTLSASGLVAGKWYRVRLTRSGTSWTLTATQLDDGTELTATNSSAESVAQVNSSLLALNPSGIYYSDGSVACIELISGGVTTVYPVQEGPGDSNTNRVLWWVDSTGASGDDGAIVNGTVSTIWSTLRCPGHVKDWVFVYGGRDQGAAGVVPSLIDGSQSAEGDPLTLSAGKHGNPYSRWNLNLFDAAECNGRSIPTAYAASDDLNGTVTPIDSAFRRSNSDGDDRVVITTETLSGSDLSNMEAYVA